MKKLAKSISKDLPPVRAYLDDIGDLYGVLKNNCKRVTLQTNEYELSDFEQLRNIPSEEIHNLKLEAHEPYILLELEEYSARIFISTDSTLTRGILSKMEEILGRCYRNIARLFIGLRANFIGPPILGALLFTSLKMTEGLLLYGLLSAIVILFVCSIIWAYRLSLKTYSTILLSERRKRKSFFAKNRDPMLVALITAVVTAIITAILMIAFG